MKIGDRVRVKHSPALDSEYVEGAHEKRRAHDGQTGVIVGRHDSHGLCFDVEFRDQAAYEPGELSRAQGD
jgi:hypothetical protein